jgi:hypothetical protein
VHEQGGLKRPVAAGGKTREGVAGSIPDPVGVIEQVAGRTSCVLLLVPHRDSEAA